MTAADNLFRITTHPFLVLLALAGGALAVNLAMRWKLPLPFCGLRELTGIPCPACGSTRSLLAWTHLEPINAFLFNPLFFLICLGVIAWALLRAMERITGRSLLSRWEGFIERLPALRIALGLLVANWVYLYLTLPR